MAAELVHDWADAVADDLREMAAALLGARSGAFRPGTIAYLTGDSGVWGEPNLWRELPPESRDWMERAAGDLARGMPGAEEDAAAELVTVAELLDGWDEEPVRGLDASDFSLGFAPEHAELAGSGRMPR